MEEEINFIRRYPLDEMLKISGNKSIEHYINNNNSQQIFMENIIINKKYIRQVTNVMILDFELVKFNYYIIKYCNDYRNILLDNNTFLIVFTKIINVLLKKEEDMVRNIDKNSIDFFFSQMIDEQTWIQDIHYKFTEKINRIYHMLVVLNGKRKDKIDFQEIIKTKTGLTIEEYLKFGNVIVLGPTITKDCDISSIIKNEEFKKIIGLNEKEIFKIIESLSGDYKYIRESNIDWQIMLNTPIIKTSRNKYIVHNIYVLLKCFSDKIYWIIRDYYKDIKSQKFVNYFGELFEDYVKELLESYNSNYIYEKIVSKDKNQNKHADWKIETNKYVIIVEQKSSLVLFKCRTTDTDTNILKKETISKYLEGIEQLKNSSEKLNVNKKVIRILLTYDELNTEETYQDYLIDNSTVMKDKSLYWLSDIGDFERLIYMLNKDENLFNELIEEKMKLEDNNSKNGRSFNTLYRKEKYNIKNDYIKEKINFYSKIKYR